MSAPDSPQFVTRSAFRVLSGTLLSRITGFLRDMTMAYAFGATAPLAAFLLAFRFVYLLRRLFGESLLHQGFIPKYEEIRVQNPVNSALFFRDLFWTLVCVMAVVVLLGEGALVLLGGELAHLSRLLLPGVMFLCLFGLTSGFLNTEKSFFLPSVLPAVLNLFWMLGVVALSQFSIQRAIFGLSLVISAAFFLQFSLTLPTAFRLLRKQLSLTQLITIRPFSARLRGLSRPLFLGVLGVAAVQINSAVDGVFASFASVEGPAYLWYAIRMQQLPLALFGIALSSALFPSLSRTFERGDVLGFQSLVNSSVKKVVFLMLPCSAGIFVLGVSSVNLLFGRGEFGQLATAQTALCLWGYGAGLIPMALTQILAPSFYAQKDYRTPAMGFLYSSVLNIALNSTLVFGLHLGPASIAWATSVSSLLNIFYLKRRLPGASFLIGWKYLGVILFATGLTAIFGFLVLGDTTISLIRLGETACVRHLGGQLKQFGVQAILFFGIIWAGLRIFYKP